jgi:radical SAM superfamily enzyme YgiQ (UPF0313 family)
MKYLLVAINAKYIHSNLAVYSLKAYAEKYADEEALQKVKIEIAEYTINQYHEEIVRDIYTRKPDVIGFSCYIWNKSIIENVVNDYKKICPNTDIWVGGPEVSYNMEQVLNKNREIDYIMYGEGEEIFKEVINSYGKNELEATIENISGISYRNGTDIKVNKPMPLVNLSEIPFVYYHMEDFQNKIIYYETSRGCPFSCSYCLSSVEKKLRFRDINLVKKELKFFIDNKTAQVKFVDRTFNCNHKHAIEIWKFIHENDNGITNFHFEIAADILTDEEIELISTMRQGLIQLEIGVQSVNDQTLTTINRKTAIEKIAAVTKKIKRAGNIHQHLDLIAGLPFEDYDSFAHSFNCVYDMQPDQLQLGFLKVLHGSEMEQRAEEFDIVYSDKPPYEVLRTKWLTYQEILYLKMIENVVEIYYNSFQFSNTISYLEGAFDSAFSMFQSLGKYYNEKSRNGEKHSRLARYEILLDFIKEHSSNQKKLYGKWTDYLSYEQLLTLDFYLRENAKTRPEFASDISTYKDKIKSFYKSEKARQLLPDYGAYDSRQLEKMTHMEVFTDSYENEIYVLFDYRNRNLLNKEAKIQIIDIEG